MYNNYTPPNQDQQSVSTSQQEYRLFQRQYWTEKEADYPDDDDDEEAEKEDLSYGQDQGFCFCICSCFYNCYKKKLVDECGAVALNAVDSVKLIFMKRIDEEYIHHIPYVRKEIPIKKIDLVHRLSDPTITAKAELTSSGARKTRLKTIISLERALKRYEKKNKRIMMHTAHPARLSEKYEKKLRKILKRYEEAEVQEAFYANEKFGFFKSILRGKLPREEYAEEKKHLNFDGYANPVKTNDNKVLG